MTGELKDLLSKVDELAEGQKDLQGKVDRIDAKVDRLDRNFNGDGGPKDRGWAGVIEDLKAQVNGLTAKATYALTWINALGMLVLGWLFTHATGQGK